MIQLPALLGKMMGMEATSVHFQYTNILTRTISQQTAKLLSVAVERVRFQVNVNSRSPNHSFIAIYILKGKYTIINSLKPSGYQLEGPQEEGRWLDAVDRDAKMLKYKNWRRSAENRDAWRQRIEEAKAQVGL